MLPRSLVALSAAALAGLSLSLGCSSGAASPTPAPAPALDAGAPPDASADAQARSAACVEQDRKLQAALDDTRKSPNAMLAVRNVACGTSVYVSGDPASATTASLWRIGSVTKTYVSAVILTLVREKKVALDSDLGVYLPDIPKTKGVTVRMLLNHTSGVFNYTADPAFGAEPQKVWTPRALVDLAVAHDPTGAPGEKWSYSNTNYVLLGMVAEKVGGARLGELVRSRALTPAGLRGTFFDGEEPLGGALATGFDARGKDVSYKFHMSGPWAAGAMTATGADLCDWIATLHGDGKVLTGAEQKLLTDGAIAMGGGASYGLGVLILDARITAGAGVGLGHDGSIDGYHTQAFYFPEKKTAICAVVNQDGKDPNDVTLAALKALF